MQVAAETTGKEDSIAVRRVRHYKEVGLQEWPLAGRATILCSIRYQSLHVSSSANDSFKTLLAPAPVSLIIHTFRTVDRPQVVVLLLSHSSGRGENLVTIARFVKPLFANMHHHVRAGVAGPCGSQTLHARTQTSPHGQCDGDVINAEFALCRCHRSSTERILFLFALFAENVAIDLKCIENHVGKPW